MKRSLASISPMTVLTVLFLLGMSIFAVVSCNTEPSESARAAQIERGKAHFEEHCVGCHGESAQGMAINVDSTIVQSADLTKIVARRDGQKFPVMEIARIIDGRQRVQAHGNSPMPLWGEVFSSGENLNEAEIKGNLGEIIAYLMSIQRAEG